MSETVARIAEQARARLAEVDRERAALDTEAAKLLAMIAAAEGRPEPVKLVPLPVAPSPLPFPYYPQPILPQPLPEPWRPLPTFPDPLTPVWANQGHGSQCACQWCCPQVICGPVQISGITASDAVVWLETGMVGPSFSASDLVTQA